MTVKSFIAAKNKKKLTMLTCYDASFARLLNDTELDCILVGDSLAMVVYGYDTTVHATTEMMARHTQAVRRGAPDKMIVSDMPFLSVQQGAAEAVKTAGALIRAGADAVKIEGYRGYEDAISAIISAGIPVMGHLGLTPQFYHAFGGFKVQGRDENSKKHILEGARILQDLGVFSIVLECIPSPLASEITAMLDIPTIGIGAGSDTDGQVLVIYDLAAIMQNKPLRFVRQYAKLGEELKKAVSNYIDDVRAGSFPSKTESFEE